MVEQKHALDTMTALWLLPAISLIVASSTGGLLSIALKAQSMELAISTALFSLTMVIIGLSLALMMITVYLARLVISGPPEKLLVLSSFIALGPFGQGGYSLLINGQNLSEILPLYVTGTFPEAGGQIIFSFCFCGAYILWSMGICWIIISSNSILSVLKKEGAIPFSITYQGLIFPNAVFALLSVQLGNVLNSDIFRGFGAAWTGQNIQHYSFLDLLTISDSHCLYSVARHFCENQPSSHRQVHICSAGYRSSTLAT